MIVSNLSRNQHSTGGRRASVAAGAALAAALTLLSSPAAAFGEMPTDGPGLYQRFCAACHGVTGVGDGPVSERLKTPPPSLTTLTERNGGVFPEDSVREVIDGRNVRKSHGSRDMPVWGTFFGIQAQYSGPTGKDTETQIQERTDALVEHIRSLQE